MHTAELYDPDNRWRHRHPAEKAALAGGLLVLAVALPPGPATALIFLLISGAALFGASVSWRRFVGGLAVPVGFLLTGTLSVLVSVGWGEGRAWPTLTLDSATAVQVLLRGLAATACLVFFATTTSFPDLLGLLRQARCPGFVIELVMLSYRFALALVQTARAVRLAQRSRLGYGSRAAGFRSFGMLATTLLPRSVEQARRLARGLETRGFDGELAVLSAPRALSWRALGAILGLHLALVGLWAWLARGVA